MGRPTGAGGRFAPLQAPHGDEAVTRLGERPTLDPPRMQPMAVLSRRGTLVVKWPQTMCEITLQLLGRFLVRIRSVTITILQGEHFAPPDVPMKPSELVVLPNWETTVLTTLWVSNFGGNLHAVGNRNFLVPFPVNPGRFNRLVPPTVWPNSSVETLAVVASCPIIRLLCSFLGTIMCDMM